MNLPPACERPLLDRFLRAEAMAMHSVRAARQTEAPPHALEFLKRHEEEERDHLSLFEKLTGVAARKREAPPRMPRQWHACAVQLLGYEALGLEFARLLASLRPDLGHILEDEETHVGFFEREVRRILEGRRAEGARQYARGFLRRLPRTVGRYLQGEELAPYRDALAEAFLDAIRNRFTSLGLVAGASDTSG